MLDVGSSLKTIVFTLPADDGEILAARLATQKWYVTRHTPMTRGRAHVVLSRARAHAAGGRDAGDARDVAACTHRDHRWRCSVGIFVASWLFRFNDPGGSFAGLTDDHFFYVVRGWQILFGDIPVRDFVDHGAPLYYYVGAAVQVDLRPRHVVGAGVLDDGPVARRGHDVLAGDARVRLDLGRAGRLPAARLAGAALLQLSEGPGLRRGDSAAVVVCRSAGHVAAGRRSRC